MRRAMTTTVVLAVLTCVGLQNVSAATQAGGGAKHDDGNDAALVAAVERGDLAAVKKLLAAGASPDAAEEEDDVPALVLSMRHGGTEIFETLLAAGADVNRHDSERNTPLLAATARGRAHFVRSLLARGARVNDTDRLGHTPLMLAAVGRLKRTLPREVLTALGLGGDKSAEASTQTGDEHTEIVALLIDSGADLDRDAVDCGMTALIIASLFADTEVAKLLLARGADPHAGRWKYSPLRLATMTGDEMERELAGEEGGGFEGEEMRVFVEWFGGTVAARAEIARLLREAGARK